METTKVGGIESGVCCAGSGCCDPVVGQDKIETTHNGEIDAKEMIRESYGEIAKKAHNQVSGSSACCPGSGCCGIEINPGAGMNESYANQAGYIAEADLGLGCGVPTKFASMQVGETVLDLGSGAGNDAFVARAAVGEAGHVIGIDMTPEMISVSRKHARKLGFTNVDFRLGEIEQLPVADNSVDLILSNCVLNLVPDKARAFSEMFRVLKPGGRFVVSDIVFEGVMPTAFRKIALLYTGCVSGAEDRNVYLNLLIEEGMVEVAFPEEKAWILPADVVEGVAPQGLDWKGAMRDLRIMKVTVTGKKPNA